MMTPDPGFAGHAHEQLCQARWHRSSVTETSTAVGLMIAATAASNQLPLYTANLDDFKGAEGFVEVVGIQARPNSL